MRQLLCCPCRICSEHLSVLKYDQCVLVTLTEKIRFIEGLFGRGILASNSRNFDVVCPLCPKKDKRPKLAILMEDDRWHCWVCGAKGSSLASLIYKSCGYADYVKYCTQFLDPSQRKHDIDPTNKLPEELKLPRDFRLLVTQSSVDPDVRGLKYYLMDERGLTERDLWYFKLGISDEPRWKRRIIVPSFDGNGKLNYFVARAIDKKRFPKYDNPEIHKTAIIFNELNIDWSQRLVLCEGSFDMFKCGDNAVPLLGSELNEHYALFNTILTHNTPVTLALDADVWDTKVPVIAKRLSEYNIDVRIADTRLIGDPGGVSKQQVSEVINAARPMSWDDTFANKLRRATRTQLSF